MKTKVDSLINWGELSRTLAKHRSSITKDRIPEKHLTEINRLRKLLEKWLASVSSNGA